MSGSTYFHRPTGHRFAIRDFVTRTGDKTYFVSDAEWVTDAEVRQGRGAPVVAQFDTLVDSMGFCDEVHAGKIKTVPHESAWEGWPALEQRVHIELLRRQGHIS